MADEYFLPYDDSKYNEGILINERNGIWSLVVARKKKDGTWMEWCFPQKRDGSKQPMDKSVPWKIKIGNSKDAAIETLRELALKLEGVPF